MRYIESRQHLEKWAENMAHELGLDVIRNHIRVVLVAHDALARAAEDLCDAIAFEVGGLTGNLRSNRLEATPYGFRWDDVEVERAASLVLRKGAKPYHSLMITTPRRMFQVDLTPSGLLAGFREHTPRRVRHASGKPGERRLARKVGRHIEMAG